MARSICFELFYLHNFPAILIKYIKRIDKQTNIVYNGNARRLKMATFAERVRELRIGAKRSQKQIAEMLNTTQTSINRYEQGYSFPPLETILWYADYFDVSLDYLFGRTDNPHGEYYAYKPAINENNEELKEFVEMCFDTDTDLNKRLKEALFNLLKEKKNG